MQKIFPLTQAKKQFSPKPEVSLPSYEWFEMLGKDSRDFLNRLSTIDVKNLKVGGGGAGFFLNAQGKIRAAFNLWQLADEHYGIELESHPLLLERQGFLDLIDELLFGEKLRILSKNAKNPRWMGLAWQAEPGERSSTAQVSQSEDLFFCDPGPKSFARDWISIWGEEASIKAWMSSTSKIAAVQVATQIERKRIGLGEPRVGFEIRAERNPLEIGCGFALAEQKGCYPGQEVIERIRSRGAPARSLVQLSFLDVDFGSAGPETHWDSRATYPLFAEDKERCELIEAGHLTSLSPHAENTGPRLGLAHVKKRFLQVGLEVVLQVSPEVRFSETFPKRARIIKVLDEKNTNEKAPASIT